MFHNNEIYIYFKFEGENINYALKYIPTICALFLLWLYFGFFFFFFCFVLKVSFVLSLWQVINATLLNATFTAPLKFPRRLGIILYMMKGQCRSGSCSVCGYYSQHCMCVSESCTFRKMQIKKTICEWAGV